MVASTHVPAWKRLGLKLKNAADVPQVTKLPKRKREPDSSQADDTISKKSKTADSATSKKKEGNPPKAIIKGLSPSRDVPIHNPAITTPHLTRQKSVSFTPETKVEDGDSVKQLFSAWVAEQKAATPDFATAVAHQPALTIPEPPQVQESVNVTVSDKERHVERIAKPKIPKEKKPKPKKVPNKSKKHDDSTAPNLAPALTYLDQFCNSKDTWKFNKIHQINLLKNVFSAESIPSANIEQFYKYMDGLQGHARVVLRDSAIEVRKKDIESGADGFDEKMSERDDKQTEYDNILEKHIAAMRANDTHPDTGYEQDLLDKTSDPAMKSRVIRRVRAERIVKSLGEPEPPKEEPKRRDDGKLVRKRKSRTTVDESSDSSSDDSSDSDSDSDTASDDDEADTKTVESSSSSSEDSSSESSDAE